MKKVAIFDICGTIYRENTTIGFLDYFLGSTESYRRFARFRSVRALRMVNQFGSGITGFNMMRSYSIGMLAGFSENEVRDASIEYVAKILVSLQDEKVVNLIGRWRDEGYEIFFYSASIEPVVAAIAGFWDAEGFEATKLEIRECSYTGRICREITGRKHEVLKDRFGDVGSLRVVTDNRSDLGLVRMANQAVVVARKPRDERFWVRSAVRNCQIL